jgi:uncharacterized GH25 family protein
MKIPLLAVAALVWLPTAAAAHDTWVQTNTNVIRMGDVIHCDLMLGNHGNEHRDFKLASKVDPAASTLEILAPDGKRYDLKDRLVDTGYTPQEGFWTAKFAPTTPGLYLVAHTFDKVMSYAPERAVKSAKTFFVVSRSLDRVPESNPGFDRALGHSLELIPETNPVTPMGPGMPLAVRLLYKGKPLPGAQIAFIPRGETLVEGIDTRYERTTDAQGRAKFTPSAANYYLIVAHYKEPKESGKGYEYTLYSATLTVYVPQICPCCGG